MITAVYACARKPKTETLTIILFPVAPYITCS